MTITAKIHHGYTKLPAEVILPDGTEVEIVVPSVRSAGEHILDTVSLPTFKGDGLHQGVNLEASRGLRRLLDSAGKPS